MLVTAKNVLFGVTMLALLLLVLALVVDAGHFARLAALGVAFVAFAGWAWTRYLVDERTAVDRFAGRDAEAERDVER